MGRNDNHHHHKSNHNKHGGNSKHSRQHHQHSSSNSYQMMRPQPFDGQCIPAPFQIPTFIQPPPLMAQYNQAYQQQPLQLSPQQQQLYYNQIQQSIPPPPPEMSRSLLMHNNTLPPIPPCNSQWFDQNLNFNLPPSGNACSGEQAISAEALNRLQLPANQITETGIIPNTPYYELPAALMVPLIPPSQLQYKPLNPADLRLPLPKFPDENFLKSMDSYYGSDGKLRDSVGWDREFIDTFIGQKNALAEC